MYELTYLISPGIKDTKAFSQKINSLIENHGGSLEKTNLPKEEELAYTIKKRTTEGILKAKTAYLASILFCLEPQQVKQLEQKLKSEDEIIRFLLVKKEKPKLKKIRASFVSKPKPKPKPILTGKTKKVKLKEIDKKLEEILEE